MQGVVASGIAFAVQIWCIDRGGPVFVAVYQPVQTLVVAIMASVALSEQFYLGGSVSIPYCLLLIHLSSIFLRTQLCALLGPILATYHVTMYACPMHP